jgi:regulation of enolase protein 1 (concanavalin A-like superfamily)
MNRRLTSFVLPAPKATASSGATAFRQGALRLVAPKKTHTPLRSSFRQNRGVSLLILGALLSMGKMVQAQEIRLVDYLEVGRAGATWEYRIADDTGKETGALRHSVVGVDPEGFAQWEGQTRLHSAPSTDFTADLSLLRKFNHKGELLLRHSQAETARDGTVTHSIVSSFDDPTQNFSSIVLGEERTLSTRFTDQEQRPQAALLNRAGTKKAVWKFESLEEVAVPAGLFQAARIRVTTEVTYDDQPGNITRTVETRWYGRGVGILRRQFAAESGGAPAVQELTSYVIPEEPQPPVPEDHWVAQDIGATSLKGTSQYDKESGIITLRASGTGISGRQDGFHFLYRQLKGDGVMVARVRDIGGDTPWVKTGIMIRESLADDSRHATIANTPRPSNSISFQRRTEKGGFTFDTTRWGGPSSVWLKLERNGNRITASYSSNGKSWKVLDTQTLALPEQVYIGLVHTSGDNESVSVASVDSLESPSISSDTHHIVERDSTFSPVSWTGSSAASEATTVSFSSTGGSIDPVEAGLFALFINRQGGNDQPLPLAYEISGPGAEFVSEATISPDLILSPSSETQAIIFRLKEGAFIPQDLDLAVRLLQTDSYSVGAFDRVIFQISARPVDSWTSQHFSETDLQNPSISGDHATPAGDGIPNLVKYALGQSPFQFTSREKLPAIHLDDGRAWLEFERPADRTDVRYIVEVSPDLREWSSGDAHVESLIQEVGDRERVIAYDRFPVGEEKQRFMRLRVERR